MDSESDEDETLDVLDPEEFAEDVLSRDFEAEKRAIMADMLPTRSRAAYELTYAKFLKWKDENNVKKIDENVLVVYFTELKLKFKPTTLWSLWSKLRTTLSLRHNININNFEDLKTLLKRNGKGYVPLKAKTFTWEQVHQFLNESDIKIYLIHQVVLIFGIFGGLRCKEFVNLTLSDIEDTGQKLIITVKDNKNDYPREFIIAKNYYNIVKQYIKLRPDDMCENRFFIYYQNGKCHRQYIGKNKISAIPSAIANYLNLANPERYTGHSLRRTAATLLSNTGCNLAFLKSHLGWRSDAVALGYVEHSSAARQEAFDRVANTNENSSNASSNDLIKEKNTNIDNLIKNNNQSSTNLNIQHSPNKLEPKNSINYKNNLDEASTSKNFEMFINQKENTPILFKDSNIKANNNAMTEPKLINDVSNHKVDHHVPKKRKLKIENSEESKSPFVFNNCTIHQIIHNNYCKNHSEINENN